MSIQDKNVDIKRGLRGVYIDTTESSFIDGINGKLLYRGYNIHELAAHSTFEEVSYLLLYGKLPTQNEFDDFSNLLSTNRRLPDEVVQTINLVKNGHPMDVLRTGVSALAAFSSDVTNNSVAATIQKGIKLTAQIPTIVATHHRLRNNLSPVQPRDDLSLAGNFLYMLFDKEPTAEEAKVMDVDFVIHAEHGSNASAFAARVTASALADLHSAVVAGIATLKGPSHGGAAEDVMKMAIEIQSPDKAKEYVDKILSNNGKVPGFGHRVYKTEDPRAKYLKDKAKALVAKKGTPDWYQILEQLIMAMEGLRAKGVYANVDFFAGAIYHLLDIPEDLFIPIFAIGRLPGWTLQAVEQYRDTLKNGTLIRPLLHYVGPMDLNYVPISERS